MPSHGTPEPKSSAIINGHGLRESILPSIRNEVMSRDGSVCVYCGDTATSLDHVIPASYGGRSVSANLVASCSWCNAQLQNKYFEDGVDEKRRYIEGSLHTKYRRVRRQLSLCADCGSMFDPAVAPATALLCAACIRIDDEIDEVRHRLILGESLVSMADEYGVTPESLHDRVFGTKKRKTRERGRSLEEMKDFIRGIR